MWWCSLLLSTAALADVVYIVGDSFPAQSKGFVAPFASAQNRGTCADKVSGSASVSDFFPKRATLVPVTVSVCGNLVASDLISGLEWTAGQIASTGTDEGNSIVMTLDVTPSSGAFGLLTQRLLAFVAQGVHVSVLEGTYNATRVKGVFVIPAAAEPAPPPPLKVPAPPVPGEACAACPTCAACPACPSPPEPRGCGSSSTIWMVVAVSEAVVILISALIACFYLGRKRLHAGYFVSPVHPGAASQYQGSQYLGSQYLGSQYTAPPPPPPGGSRSHLSFPGNSLFPSAFSPRYARQESSLSQGINASESAPASRGLRVSEFAPAIRGLRVSEFVAPASVTDTDSTMSSSSSLGFPAATADGVFGSGAIRESISLMRNTLPAHKLDGIEPDP